MSRAAFIATLIVTAAAAAVFVAWPHLDLDVAGAFFTDRHAFHGGDPGARAFRSFFYVLPFVVAAPFVLAWVAKRAGAPLPEALTPSNRSMIFLAATLLIGPGLLVNVGLKDHWGRPRPVQSSEFNGKWTYEPFWRPGGECIRNCSFVSGETSTAAWLLAPASLAPPPFRAPAIGAAVVAIGLTALGRLAFGGHYLSDVVFGALFTLLTIQAIFALVVKPGGRPRPGVAPASPASIVPPKSRGDADTSLPKELSNHGR